MGLEAVAASQAAKQPKHEEALNASKKEGEEADSAAGSDEDADDRLNDSGLDDDADSLSADFIPLSNSGVQVVTQKALVKKKLSSTESALKFRQERLYNQQALPRESNKQRQAKALKRKLLKGF